MQLSNDGTTLIKVDENDITNGTINISEGVTTIGDRAFFECIGLTQLSLPESVTTIGDSTFAICSGLTQLTLSEDVKIGAHAFSFCTSLTQLTLPKGVKIGFAAFYECSGLTQLTFPEGLTTIDDCAFHRCMSLTQLTFPEGLTTIGRYAFHRCMGLTQLTFPEGVTTIDDCAFHECDALQTVVVNTNNDEEIERIKNSLPSEHRYKVTKNPIYDSVIKFQKDCYQNMLHKPSLSDLSHYFDFFKKKLPFDALTMLAGFEEGVYQSIKKKVKPLEFPITPEAFEQYKVDYKRLLSTNINPKTVENLLSCIAKLQKYVDKVDELKKLKQKKHPDFFNENPALSTEINEKLDVTRKAIDWLKGDTSLCFTQEEINVLDTSVVKILKDFSITLPTEEPPQELPRI